jgi:hypothetical protein
MMSSPLKTVIPAEADPAEPATQAAMHKGIRSNW